MVDEKMARRTVAGTQAIRRSVEVLRTIAQLQRTGATAGRVSRATGLSRPTVFRILQALEAERLLDFDEGERSYWLGPLAFELGLAARPKTERRGQWQAAVEQVAARTRLTSYLIGRSGDEAVCLISVQGAAPIRAMPIEVGQRVPLGLGAGSLAILASLEDRDVTRIVGHHKSRLDVFPGGAGALDGVLNRVQRTRQAGYAVSSGTVAKGVSGVGVLIPGRPPSERLAITVSAVADTMLEPDARKLAEEISRAIASAG
ncbi:MAG: helix-turn-helix domain-containing protein [Novosphingobium sp.]|nr:helix-turn-helix domain-containing protein [Novosphingobium sp.]